MDYIVNKNKQVSVYKPFGNIVVLPYRFKQQRKGVWLYLPSQLVASLGIEYGKDGDLIAFLIDDEDLEHNFIVLTRDRAITNKLQPLLLNLKCKALDRLEAARKLAESTANSENADSVSLSNGVENR